MMTKEEFQAGIQEILDDVEDPNSEFNTVFLKEGKEYAEEVKAFDPILAEKVVTLIKGFEDLASYVRSRSERKD